MEAQKGIWTISKGKNDRVFIKCSEFDKVFDFHETPNIFSFGIYGYDHLSDLAVCILIYEKLRQESQSISQKLKDATND